MAIFTGSKFGLIASLLSSLIICCSLLITTCASSDPTAPTGDSWCFVKEGCNQNSPNSAWNQGTCKNGKKQSPIDIPEDYDFFAGKNSDEIDLSQSRLNYDFLHFQMKNTGKHVTMSGFVSVSGKKPSFTWSEREESVYTLQEIHVHWGNTNLNGSEHSVGGKKFALEMHMVHYRTSGGQGSYGDLAEAKRSGHQDAVATIAVLFNADSFGSGVTTSLQPMIKNLGKVVRRYDKVSVDEGILRISDILRVQEKAVSYYGSISTPPCDEVVVWLVIPDPINIKVETTQIFRDAVHGVDGNVLNTNRRRTQPIQDRIVKIVNFKQ